VGMGIIIELVDRKCGEGKYYRTCGSDICEGEYYRTCGSEMWGVEIL